MPATSPTSSSTPCSCACWCIFARSRQRSASSTPMPAPAFMTSAGAEARRSGEWRDGIGRLLAAPIGEQARGAARPVSRCACVLQFCRPACQLSGLARSRARISASAGSPHRLRARAERGGGAGTPSRRRPAQQGGRDRRLDRAQRLCAAEGAARARARSTRHSRTPAIFRGSSARSKPPTANGPAAPICSGTRSRSARPRRAGAAAAA